MKVQGGAYCGKIYALVVPTEDVAMIDKKAKK